MAMLSWDELCLQCTAARELREVYYVNASNSILLELRSVNISCDKDKPCEMSCFGNLLSEMRKCNISLKVSSHDAVEVLIEPSLLIHKLCTFLSSHLDVEGLFRISGSWRRIALLKRSLEDGQEVNSEHPHDVANILCQFLRQLPVHLFPKCMNGLINEIMLMNNEEDKKEAMSLLCLLLPSCHLYNLMYVCRFFNKLVQHCDKNRMSLTSVSTVLTPNVVHIDMAVESGAEFIATMSKFSDFISLLIKNSDIIGRIPAVFEEVVCRPGECVHRDEWMLIVEGGLNNRNSTKRKSLADRFFQVCGKGKGGNLNTTKESKKRHRDVTDDACPAKRRSLQGAAENVSSFAFNGIQPPLINFVDDQNASSLPANPCTRHDSGSTTCFGVKSRVKRNSRKTSMTSDHNALGVPCPVTPNDMSMAGNSSCIADKQKKTLLKKLTYSFKSPSLRRSSRKKRVRRALDSSSDQTTQKEAATPVVPGDRFAGLPMRAEAFNSSLALPINDSITIFDISINSPRTDDKKTNLATSKGGADSLASVAGNTGLPPLPSRGDGGILTSVQRNTECTQVNFEHFSGGSACRLGSEVDVCHDVIEDELNEVVEESSAEASEEVSPSFPGVEDCEADDEHPDDADILQDNENSLSVSSIISIVNNEAAALIGVPDVPPTLCSNEEDFLAGAKDDGKQPNSTSCGLHPAVTLTTSSSEEDLCRVGNKSYEDLLEAKLETSIISFISSPCAPAQEDAKRSLPAASTETDANPSDPARTSTCAAATPCAEPAATCRGDPTLSTASPRSHCSDGAELSSNVITDSVAREGCDELVSDCKFVMEHLINGVVRQCETDDDALPCGRIEQSVPDFLRNVTERRRPKPPVRTSSRGVVLRARNVIEETPRASLDEHCVVSMYSLPNDRPTDVFSPLKPPSHLPMMHGSFERVKQTRPSQKIKLFEKIPRDTRSSAYAKMPPAKTGRVLAKIDHFNHLCESKAPPEVKKLPPLPYKGPPTRSSSFKLDRLRRQCTAATPKMNIGAQPHVGANEQPLQTFTSAKSNSVKMPMMKASLLPGKQASKKVAESSPVTGSRRVTGHRKSKSLDGLIRETKEFRESNFAQDDCCRALHGRPATPLRCTAFEGREKRNRATFVLHDLNIDKDVLDCSPVKRATPKLPRSRAPMNPLSTAKLP